MYQRSNDWLNYVKLPNDYPIALTFKINNFRHVISLKDIRTLCTYIEMCNLNNYEYDFIIGLELTKEEKKLLKKTIPDVYIS